MEDNKKMDLREAIVLLYDEGKSKGMSDREVIVMLEDFCKRTLDGKLGTFSNDTPAFDVTRN